MFYDFQPDLNMNNPGVRAEMILALPEREAVRTPMQWSGDSSLRWQ